MPQAFHSHEGRLDPRVLVEWRASQSDSLDIFSLVQICNCVFLQKLQYFTYAIF
jgi:hypothetical protein